MGFGTLGERDAWIVSVGVPGAPATVWVDAQTHAVLRVRYDISARNVSFTDERLTPLRRRTSAFRGSHAYSEQSVMACIDATTNRETPCELA